MPNRIIKESIKRSPEIDSLSWFEEVVFYRLIVTADDYGCCDGRTILLKNELFPTKDTVTKKAIEDAISKLVSVGLLCEYTASGMPYLFFPTWEKHQRIRNKHRKYPEPLDGHLTANCCQMTASCQSESESNPNPNPNPNPTTARVVAVYLDRINPSASQTSIQELCAFADEMGDEVCLRAFDIALDSKKATWPYIRGILRKWQAAGVKCLADIAEKGSKPGNKPKNGPACSDYKSPDTVAQMKKDLDDLARFAGG